MFLRGLRDEAASEPGPMWSSWPHGASVWGAWDAYIPTGQGTGRSQESPGSWVQRTSLSEQGSVSTGSKPGATDSATTRPPNDALRFSSQMTTPAARDGGEQEPQGPSPPSVPHLKEATLAKRDTISVQGQGLLGSEESRLSRFVPLPRGTKRQSKVRTSQPRHMDSDMYPL